MTFSCSGPACPFSAEATSWKFFTEATVTRPWKFKHQHWSCSCHLGALFFKTRAPRLWSVEGSERNFSSRLDFDGKNGTDGKESTLLRGKSVCVGATPPGSMAEAGMASMVQFNLLGPLFVQIEKQNYIKSTSMKILKVNPNNTSPNTNFHSSDQQEKKEKEQGTGHHRIFFFHI